MAHSKEKNRFRLSVSFSRKSKIAVMLAATILVTLTVIIIFMIKQNREDMWNYSGAEVDRSSQLLYDVDCLGKFTVVSDRMEPDGKYSEHIIVQNAIDVRLWRNFERPKLPCREQIEEKYPDLTGYSREKAPQNAIYSQRGTFRTEGENGGTFTHTVVLLRRDGWDYLVDFSVREENRKTYEDKIDEIIDNMIMIP